ncbi:uncharacterized protein B0I36DRAFT_81070 [Microdochium trichocladiopsis]|uniref:Uncharacterized protein n=1 Tax=Microdochium trichocladiopsis TaxID=1682393 RepID=A0A9P8XQQ6_9PEZI|nr:uncharacterized protein B0I36DRAFT_81070 [Microdochium trichocladiopsis]KAH7007841.1 hypothetical protein B0I36DRAFT_81070 [Microdochium trichocladiopsis]
MLSARCTVSFIPPPSFIVARMAYIRLLDLFDTIEDIVKADRRKDKLYRRNGISTTRHNASIAIDLCISAFQISRSVVLETKRIARRWRRLVKPSVFFLMVYVEGPIEAAV